LPIATHLHGRACQQAIAYAERKEIKYPAVGEEITGKVEGVQNFGVFVQVSEDVRGMLHQAEVATPDSREPNMRAMFNVGDDIKVSSGLPCLFQLPIAASLGSCM
jgi:ribosomal protein S1